MSASPDPQLRSLHPQVRDRLRKLDGLERNARRQRRDRLRVDPPVDEDGQGEGWMLSYLDLVTLMLVLLVALVALSGMNPGDPVEQAGAATVTPAVADAARSGTDAREATAPAADAEPASTAPEAPVADASAPVAGAPGAMSDATAPDALAPAPADTPATLKAPQGPADAPAAEAPGGPETLPDVPPSPGPVRLAGSVAPAAPDAPARWSLPGFADLAERHAAAAPPPATGRAGATPPAPAPRTPLPDLASLGLDKLGEGIDVIVNEQSVSFRISNEILFPSGQADLIGSGSEVIGRLAEAIARHPYPVSVEGHTDVVPIQTNRFPSNWELSTARATSVLRQLVNGGVASDRLRAVGWAHTRPIADNGTATGRATNRRVELIMEIPPGPTAPPPMR